MCLPAVTLAEGAAWLPPKVASSQVHVAVDAECLSTEVRLSIGQEGGTEGAKWDNKGGREEGRFGSSDVHHILIHSGSNPPTWVNTDMYK